MLITQIFSDTWVPLSGWAVGLWAVLIIGGTLLTVWFYSHRDAELAENVARDNWFRLILKITSSFLLATVFAYMIFAVITTGGIYRSPSEEMAFVLGALPAPSSAIWCWKSSSDAASRLSAATGGSAWQTSCWQQELP